MAQWPQVLRIGERVLAERGIRGHAREEKGFGIPKSSIALSASLVAAQVLLRAVHIRGKEVS
jgi:hypothetical protein